VGFPVGRALGWAGLALLLVSTVGRSFLPEPLYVWPEQWRIDIATPISAAMNGLLKETEIAGFLVRDGTRSFGEVLGVPMRLLQSLLSSGFLIPGATPAETLRLPPLSWLGLVAAAVFLCHRLGGFGLALLSAATLLYCAAFGLWAEAMLTLASVLVIVAVGFVLGLALGIFAWRSQVFEAVASQIYDVMQTMPVFSYLVPMLLLFGFGPVAALVATIIFALPPMARATTLALRRVPSEIGDLADMAGASPRQKLLILLLPSAREDLLLGVNQLVMLSLAMVILASMIGAGGLGGEVLKALQALRFGKGLEAGLAISLLAILLYRICAASAHVRPRQGQRLFQPRDGATVLMLLAVPTALGFVLPQLAHYPDSWTFTTNRLWTALMDAINSRWGDDLEAIRVALVVGLLQPFRMVLLDLGWAGLAGALLCFGAALGRNWLGLGAALSVVLIAALGYWDRTATTLHLVIAGSFLAILFGLPVGMLSASSRRLHHVIDALVDTLLTLPSFVYLVPVVMLLGPGSVSAIIAIAAFVFATVVRYADHALRNVPPALTDAAAAFGATPWQTLVKFRIPVAFPALMLGLSQTVLMAFGMVVVTALVGTTGLEQETVTAIARVDPGRGLVAGAAICALAMIAERFLTALAERTRCG